MGRLIVLCLMCISVLAFPGNVGAISIEGAVWSTDAYDFAKNPSLGAPSVDPDAYFLVEAINFDSLRSEKPKNIIFDEFLNPLEWKIPENSKFKPDEKMFNGNNQGDEGIFFRFTFTLDLSGGTLPVTISHDDGFVFSIPIFQYEYSVPDPVETPQVAKFDLKGFDPGQYTVILDFGAINDSDSHVLIFSTPEPGSMLLLFLGIMGIGVLRRRN